MKLKCDEPLSKFAFNCNLRPYTEVAEHMYHPAAEFDAMASLVRPGGFLAVLTSFQPDDDAAFADWHYRRDPTHVVFYRAETLVLLAHERGWTCEIPAKDVAVMRKPPARE